MISEHLFIAPHPLYNLFITTLENYVAVSTKAEHAVPITQQFYLHVFTQQQYVHTFKARPGMVIATLFIMASN